MTVNEYRETACATAGSNDEAEMEENVIRIPPQQEAENENLLGRVLAGEYSLIYRFFHCICSYYLKKFKYLNKTDL